MRECTEIGIEHDRFLIYRYHNQKPPLRFYLLLYSIAFRTLSLSAHGTDSYNLVLELTSSTKFSLFFTFKLRIKYNINMIESFYNCETLQISTENISIT